MTTYKVNKENIYYTYKFSLPISLQNLEKNVVVVVFLEVGVGLLEMTLKCGIVPLCPPSTVTFQALRRLTKMCVQLANVPL